MKTIKSICWPLLVAAGAILPTKARADEFRTDINPALIYYRSYLETPEASAADHDYLFTNEWRGEILPKRFGDLIGGYDNQFKLVRQASHSTVPCDWGIDLSPGPGTLLPQLARIKGIAQTTRLRALWDFQNGRPAEAKEDLVAALALSRNSSRDGTLISALVQIAAENILCSIVAENFDQWSPEMLQQLEDGFAAGPQRGMITSCLATEKTCFRDWLSNKIKELQRNNPGNDAKVMAGIRDIFSGYEGPQEGQTNAVSGTLWNRVNEAAGGTSEGVLQLLKDEDPYFQRLAAILALPEAESEIQM
jgi:hypothetical protein